MTSSEQKDKNLSVAMVIDTWDDARNGAVISTQRFTNMLREDGNTVFVITSGKEEAGKIALKEFYAPIVKKVMQKMKFSFAWPNKKKITAIFPQLDLIHNHMPFWLSYKTIKWARKANIPVISTFHVQAEQIAHNAGFRQAFVVKFVYKLFVRFIYNKSDLVICPSKFAEDEIKRQGCTTPTVVISNGVTNQYKVLKNIPKKSDLFTILSVGRNAYEKRQDMILRAVARSKYKEQIHVQIIGDGPRRPKLEALSKKLQLKNIEFNSVSQNEVVQYYNQADLYIHAAAVEVECMTATEAMACGMPLLIADSDLSATKQFALNNDFLFKDEEELVRKIEYYFEHQEALTEARTAYLEKAKQYSIDISYQKLLAAYRSVLK
ncbi:MAG: glycosyltransferase [Chitinophagales bacterium]|nr:glycosyltransferase [Chitinophagales bacterium]